MDEQEVSNDNERLKEEAESFSDKCQKRNNILKWLVVELRKAVVSQFYFDYIQQSVETFDHTVCLFIYLIIVYTRVPGLLTGLIILLQLRS